jgi:hypothetical protein
MDMIIDVGIAASSTGIGNRRSVSPNWTSIIAMISPNQVDPVGDVDVVDVVRAVGAVGVGRIVKIVGVICMAFVTSYSRLKSRMCGRSH